MGHPGESWEQRAEVYRNICCYSKTYKSKMYLAWLLITADSDEEEFIYQETCLNKYTHTTGEKIVNKQHLFQMF